MNITKIKVNYGISFEEGGIWHKPEFGIEVELDLKEDIQDVIKKSWILVKAELQKQLEDD